ncbi:hypothetical protein LguiB_006090 [Lonicera macranthoides]
MGITEFGKAVAVGSSTCNKTGNTIPVAAKEGDVVLLPVYYGTQVELGDKNPNDLREVLFLEFWTHPSTQNCPEKGLACQASSNVALDRVIIKMMIKHTINYVEESRRGKKDEIAERTLKGASTPSNDLISFVCAYRRGIVFSTLGRQQQKDLIHRVHFINSKYHTRPKTVLMAL